jgi:hypothetical protein
VIDIAEDAVSRIYVERCDFFESTQVKLRPQWNGIWDEGYKALVMEIFVEGHERQETASVRDAIKTTGNRKNLSATDGGETKQTSGDDA